MIIRKIVLLFSLLIALTVSAQYEKPENVIRFMTYNVAYCRGYDSYQDGSKTNPYNTERIGKIIKALNPDAIAFQELDSGNVNNRFLLEDIKKASGIDYQVIYGMSDLATFGNYGCGILIKKDFPVLSVKKLKLPGTVYGSNPPIKNNDRLLLRVETARFYFMCTHLDLDTDQRVSSAGIINNELDYMRKPTFFAGDMNDSHRWGGGAFAQFFNDKWDIYSTTDYTLSNENNKNTIDYILYYNYKNKTEYSPVSTFAIRGRLNIPNEVSYIDRVEFASDHLPVILDVKDNTSNSEMINNDNLNVYVNGNYIYINQLNDLLSDFSIYDMMGNCVSKEQVQTGNSTVSVEGLPKGFYVFVVTDKEGKTYNLKFLKEENVL